MDSLPEAKQTAIRKMRKVRLANELIKRGWDEEEVEEMNRDRLMEEWAKIVAAGQETPTEGGSPEMLRIMASHPSEELERERLAFEQRKYEEEKRERDREREERREREQREEREKEREYQLRAEQLQLEKERLRQTQLSTELQDQDRTTRRSLASRIKFFSDALKATIGKFPSDVAEIPCFFSHIERLFETVRVDDDVKPSLLMSQLSDKARTLTSRLTTEQMCSYTAIKDFLLREYRVSPIQLRERFFTTRKANDETYIALASRLKNTLAYYVQSRNIARDYDSLMNLFCSDRLKELLPRSALDFILTQEQEDWMKVDDLARAVDTYMASRHLGGEPSKGINPNPTQGSHQPRVFHTNGAGTTQKSTHLGPGKTEPKVSKEEAIKKGLCFKCGVGGHRSHECGKTKGNMADKRVAKVRACPVTPLAGATSDSSGGPCDDADERREEHQVQLGLSSSRTNQEGINPQDLVIDTAEFHPRSYVRIHIEGLGSYLALIDSGAQVCCVKQALVQHLQLPVHRQIRVIGMNGCAEIANVVQVHARPVVDETTGLKNIAPAVRIWLASVAELAEDVIITPNVLEALQTANEYNVMATPIIQEEGALHELEPSTAVEVADHVNSIEEERGAIVEERHTVLSAKGPTPQESSVSVLETTDSNRDVSEQPVFLDPDQTIEPPEVRSVEADRLAEEQKSCVLLKSYFELAKQHKNNFFIKNGLLYRKDEIVGHKIEQLCLPESRVGTVLEMAHDAAFAGHMGYKTTRDRIRLSFWFPQMDERVQSYCASCPVCQLRTPVKVNHRVPIQPIPRNDELPFSSVAADCIGPLIAEGDPTSSKPEFNYALVIVDRFSRWPMAYPLRSLSAKAVCEAFIQMFMTFSVPKTIATDCGSNFKSKLTQEFLKRLGCCPRFTTPGHPQGNGLAERTNGSIKTMLYKLAQDDPKGWHKLLPYVLWGLRERPSATTHVSPYMMVYGTVPRGPLSILKESWMGEREIPFSLGKTPEKYLQDLKDNLEMARAYADYYSDLEQRRTTEYYNLRSMDRKYTVGEKVIVLAPDPKGAKFFNRWQGPGVIAEVKSPYSYVVEIDGRRRHVHANKIRKYNERIRQALVNNCAVIFDRDEDFGRIELIDSAEPSAVRPSQLIERERVAHLSDIEQKQLLTLLDNYTDVFSDKPGYCDLFEHEIKILPSFTPKRLRAYRIPELLKPEVQRQIDEMLKLGIISPSTSDMASPIVCVMKGPDGKGGVRLAIDYRHVNQHSAGDKFPTPDVQDVLQRVGKSHFISCFDANSGYWQLNLRQDSRPLSAFVCDAGLFEFNRMPFGLKSAANTFIRCVSIILQPIKAFAEPFVDDMAVHSMTWNDHLKHLDQFLRTIQKSGLTLNLKKCAFAQRSAVFVGHVIGSGRIEPDPRKLECIGDLQPPKTKKEVRSLIGFFSYFRNFIPGLAETAHALTSLTQKNQPTKVQWGPEHQRALDKLKLDLSNAVRLYTIDFSKEFGLSVDASGVAVGCCLFQWSAEGIECPVAFASSKLTDTQTRWATIEREAYGVIWALKRFRSWIFLAKVTIFSDHNPLSFLTEATPKSAKLARWALALQEFDIQFKYRPGKNNLVADFLSRA